MRFFIVFLLMFICGCASTEIPNVGEQGYVVEEDEQRMYNRSQEMVELLQDSGYIYQNQELEDYLNRLAKILFPDSAQANGLDVNVRVLADPTLNAFAVPNGWIFVNTGILAATDNEAQIATLLAHEMIHVTHRHALKGARSYTNKSAWYSVISMPIAVASGPLGTILTNVAANSSIYGFSKDSELEADAGGFEIIRALDYDVHESVKLFEHLKDFIEEEELKTNYFFSTHPAVKRRIQSYERLIRENGLEEVKGRIDILNEFGSFKKDILKDNTHYCLERGMFKTAKRNIDNYIENDPNDAYGYYLKGELFRQQTNAKDRADSQIKEDYKNAITAYDQALRYDQNHALSYKGKALVLRRTDQIKEAKEAYRKYLNINPEAPERAFIEQFLNQ